MMSVDHGEHFVRVKIYGLQSSANRGAIACLSTHNTPSHRMMINAESLSEDGFQRMRQWPMPNIVQ